MLFMESLEASLKSVNSARGTEPAKKDATGAKAAKSRKAPAS